MQYYVKWRGKAEGPLSEIALEQKIRSNGISRIALVSGDGKTWMALAKTEIYKRITEAAMQKAAPPKPDPVKIKPPAVPAPEPAAAEEEEEEEDDPPVMARQFVQTPPTPRYRPSSEELRGGYYPAQRVWEDKDRWDKKSEELRGGHYSTQPIISPSVQPYYDYGLGNPAHRYDLDDNSDVSERSRVTYQWLGFFLGRLGVHNFYAGRTGIALTQLGFTGMLLGLRIFPYCGLFAVPGLEVLLVAGVIDLILTLWVWVDIFSVDRDGDNRIMRGQSIAGMLLLFTVVLIVLLGVLVALLMNAAGI